MSDLGAVAGEYLTASSGRLVTGVTALRQDGLSPAVLRQVREDALVLLMAFASAPPARSLPTGIHRRLLIDLTDPQLDLSPGDLGERSGAGDELDPAAVPVVGRFVRLLIEAVRELFELRTGVHAPGTDFFGVPQHQMLVASYARVVGMLRSLQDLLGPGTEDAYGLSLATTVLHAEGLLAEAVAGMAMLGELDRAKLDEADALLRAKLDELSRLAPSPGSFILRQVLEKKRWQCRQQALALRRMATYPPPLGDSDEWVDIHQAALQLAEDMDQAVRLQADALLSDVRGFATSVLGMEGSEALLTQHAPGDLSTQLRAQRLFSDGRVRAARISATEARLLVAVVQRNETEVDELTDEIAGEYLSLMSSSTELDGLVRQLLESGTDGPQPEDSARPQPRPVTQAVAEMEKRSARARKAARQAVRSGTGIADVVSALARLQPVSVYANEVVMGSKYEINAPVTGAVGDHAVGFQFQGSLAGIDQGELARELAALRATLSERGELDERDGSALEDAEAAARQGDERTLVRALKALGAGVWSMATAVGTGIALAAARQRLGL